MFYNKRHPQTRLHRISPRSDFTRVKHDFHRVSDFIVKARDSSTAFHSAQNDNKKSDYYLTVMLSVVETSKKCSIIRGITKLARGELISLRSNITRARREYHCFSNITVKLSEALRLLSFLILKKSVPISTLIAL